MSLNFFVKFTCVNRIEAMCENPRVTVKLSEVQLSFVCDLPYIATFLGSRKIYAARDNYTTEHRNQTLRAHFKHKASL